MESFIWTAYLILIIVFITFSLVLMHHWSYYGIRGRKKTATKVMFFVGGILLLITIAISLLLYQVTI